MKIPPRRRAREVALQGLYQWQVNPASLSVLLENLSELEHYGSADNDFLRTLLGGVLKEHVSLEARVKPFVDRKWSEVTPVEKAILLIGAFELVHMPEVPYRVTINEGIELAKRFGGTDGHKYVNGILDKLAAEVRPDEIKARTKTA
ncbi:Transcription antitermination protein NusB [Usitatibacter rugosus]|uniref:Transcription antitermination protein NusB n=1 Tax=Usitatibacter rugosus TaxID=2732067 RepID=A0A6M4GW43_9PROT|nr:transcription antitermination factor NusB [Usitatibacter rugosus]QJR10563.1 Transcription antitermination protein NusB [Usitatibacter rugosus]